MRGILASDYGVDLDNVEWITFEDPHVAEYRDPAIVKRAPTEVKTSKPNAMLTADEVLRVRAAIEKGVI